MESREQDRGDRRHRSPERKLRFEDEEREDDEIKENVVDRQLRELNEERRVHFQKKTQISQRIESKTRELDFIKGLDSDDVIYMMHKKDLYAVKVIQRWFRVKKMQKIFTKETHFRIQQIKAATMVQKAWRFKKRSRYLANYKKAKSYKEDHYYDPISEGKLKEYEDMVKQRIKTFSLAELGEKEPENLERECIGKYRSFYDNYGYNEVMRRKANWL
jgi:hypothetical protein